MKFKRFMWMFVMVLLVMNIFVVAEENIVKERFLDALEKSIAGAKKTENQDLLDEIKNYITVQEVKEYIGEDKYNDLVELIELKMEPGEVESVWESVKKTAGKPIFLKGSAVALVALAFVFGRRKMEKKVSEHQVKKMEKKVSKIGELEKEKKRLVEEHLKLCLGFNGKRKKAMAKEENKEFKDEIEEKIRKNFPGDLIEAAITGKGEKHKEVLSYTDNEEEVKQLLKKGMNMSQIEYIRKTEVQRNKEFIKVKNLKLINELNKLVEDILKINEELLKLDKKVIGYDEKAVKVLSKNVHNYVAMYKEVEEILEEYKKGLVVFLKKVDPEKVEETNEKFKEGFNVVVEELKTRLAALESDLEEFKKLINSQSELIGGSHNNQKDVLNKLREGFDKEVNKNLIDNAKSLKESFEKHEVKFYIKIRHDLAILHKLILFLSKKEGWYNNVFKKVNGNKVERIKEGKGFFTRGQLVRIIKKYDKEHHDQTSNLLSNKNVELREGVEFKVKQVESAGILFLVKKSEKTFHLKFSEIINIEDTVEEVKNKIIDALKRGEPEGAEKVLTETPIYRKKGILKKLRALPNKKMIEEKAKEIVKDL